MKKEYIKATATIYAVQAATVLAGSDVTVVVSGGSYSDGDWTVNSKDDSFDSFENFDFEEEY